MRLSILAMLACAIALPALAQSPNRAERIVRAWSDWVEAGGTAASTIAVMRAGELVASEGAGVPADTALPLASLSKAITAACAAALPASAGLSMDAAVGSVVEDAPGARDRTLGQLLTHTSGIWPDATQGDAGLRGAASPRTAEVARRALARDRQEGQVGAYAYNNENYAIAGLMIEAATGRTYADACLQAVLEPLGIRTGAMDGEWAAHGPWGGWSMSAPDYARFARSAFGPDAPFGGEPGAWPAADLGDGARYGMGAYWREIRGRHLIWSSGMLCWDGRGNGGYVASYGGEWLVVALYAECLEGTTRLRDLDGALFDAAVR